MHLLTGQAVPIWDADHAFASWHSLVADFARNGELLLWNPWTNAGSPDFTDPQFGALSPLTVSYAWLFGGSLMAFNAYWLLVWGAGGVGMVVLARHLRAPAWGGFMVGVAFLFSGFMTGHAQHTPVLLVFSALPWILWRVDVALERNRVWPAVEAGVLMGLCALAGYPGMVMAASGYTLLWAMGRAFIADPAWSARVRPDGERGRTGVSKSTLLLSLALLFLITAIIASPTYVAFLVEGQGYSDRAGALARDLAVGSNALHPGALATFSSPLLSILQWRSDLWVYTDISSSSIYVGVLASWLAAFALVAQPRERWRWWLFSVGVLGLALALGQTLPLRGWLYDLVPPSRYFRHASIFRSYFVFSTLVLALYGTRDLRTMLGRAAGAGRRGGWTDPRDGRLWQALQLSAIGITVVAVVAYWSVAGPRIGTAGIVITLSPWLALLIAAAASPRLKVVRPAVPVMLVLVVVLDAIITIRIAGFTVATGHPLALAAWEWVEENRSERTDLESLERIAYLPIANGHTNKHLGVKTAVLSAYTPNENRAHLEWVKDTILSTAALGHDRVWFAADDATPNVSPSYGEFAAFVDRTHALEAMPAVVHPRDAMLRSGRGSASSSAMTETAMAPAAERLPFTLLGYEPTSMSLRITAPQSGYVIVTDRWARGWQASVDGATSPILGANFIFRAIPVGKGTHDIVMRYEPFGLPWLLIVSWGTIAVTCAISVSAAVQRVVRTRPARQR
jgi:hypothetical protein